MHDNQNQTTPEKRKMHRKRIRTVVAMCSASKSILKDAERLGREATVERGETYLVQRGL